LAPPRRRRALRLSAAAVGALVVLVLVTPTVLSFGLLRGIVDDQLSQALRGEASVESASFGWWSGLQIEGLQVANPPGFPTDRPAVRMQSLAADVSLGALLFGALEAEGEIVGLEVQVEQRADGASNLQQLVASSGDSGSPAPQAPKEEESDPAPFALDFHLRDSAVTIRREGEVLEALTELTCHAKSASDSDEVDVEASGTLRAGDLAVALAIDPVAETTRAELTAHGLDLATWRPLLDALMPGQFEALAGKVDGDVSARLHSGDQLELEGDLLVGGPRIAGPVVQGMDLRSEQWRISPALTLGAGASSDIDASSFAVDLEWLQIRGDPATRQGRVAMRYDVDVATLAEFGGPMPALLKGSGTTLAGTVDVPSKDLPTDLAGWVQAIAATADLRVRAMDVGGFALRDLGLDLDVDRGALRLTTTPEAKLDGGALAIRVGVDLNDMGSLPLDASIQWQGGRLTGGATESLRYVAPMFAGLKSGLAEVLGDVELDVSFSGPARKADDENWLTWLDAWSGDGSLGLANASFAPSSGLEGLLQPLGALGARFAPIAKDGKLTVDSLVAPFSLRKGKLATRGAKWLAAGKEIGLEGFVGLDGVVDYALDFAPLLRGHKDGERVLAALGGKLQGARLTGDIHDPKLKLPELGDVATKLLEQQGKQLLEGGIEKGLQRLFGRKKKDR